MNGPNLLKVSILKEDGRKLFQTKILTLNKSESGPTVLKKVHFEVHSEVFTFVNKTKDPSV